MPFNLVGYSVDDPLMALIFLIPGVIAIFFHDLATLVAFQNMVTSRMRATAAFTFFFVTTMIGVGIGPAIVRLLSDFYAYRLHSRELWNTLRRSAVGAVGRQDPDRLSSGFDRRLRYALWSATGFPAWTNAMSASTIRCSLAIWRIAARRTAR